MNERPCKRIRHTKALGIIHHSSSTQKFNIGKYWVLHLKWSNAGHRPRLGVEWMESSPAGRALGVLTDSRFSMILEAKRVKLWVALNTSQPISEKS